LAFNRIAPIVPSFWSSEPCGIKQKKAFLSVDARRFVHKSLRRKWPARLVGILGAITLILIIWGTPALQRYQQEPDWHDPQLMAWGIGLILFVIIIALFLLNALKSIAYGALRVWKERTSH
jgi:hypothetical protein